MSWWVIVIEALVFAGIFTAVVLPSCLSDKKYSPESIHNYPPDIQEEYFKTHERVDVPGIVFGTIPALVVGLLIALIR